MPQAAPPPVGNHPVVVAPCPVPSRPESARGRLDRAADQRGGVPHDRALRDDPVATGGMAPRRTVSRLPEWHSKWQSTRSMHDSRLSASGQPA
jgi:hypothetical protein